LERLSAYFCVRSGEGRRRREFLLYSMGGSGKSQIALKFAEEYGQRSVLP
jgi:phage/plasmid-associated DNA primase